MKHDSRLSSVLHVLLHMAESERALTSEQLAGYLDTNPVVVRRVLGGLRSAGLVDSVRGHGGGWSLTCDLRSVTLRDVYEAIGSPAVFAIGNRRAKPACPVEQIVNEAVDGAFREAEGLLAARFASISLADLTADFKRRLAARPRKKSAHHAH